jgi:hypothetical protein
MAIACVTNRHIPKTANPNLKYNYCLLIMKGCSTPLKIYITYLNSVVKRGGTNPTKDQENSHIYWREDNDR